MVGNQSFVQHGRVLVLGYDQEMSIGWWSNMTTMHAESKPLGLACATFLSSWPGVLCQLRCVLCRAAQRNRLDFVQRDRNLDKMGILIRAE